MREPRSSATDPVPITAETLFAGPGEMRARCRAYDWEATALGAVAGWPPSLRALAPLVLAAGVPTALLWGPEQTVIYNDAYIPLLGAQHPVLLGRPHFDVVPESRAAFEPLFARVHSGETVSLADVPTTFRRDAVDGPMTTSFYTFSFAPVRDVDDPAGPVVGIYAIVVETTAEVARRSTDARQAYLLALSDALRPLVDPVEIQGVAARLLGEQLGAERVLYAETEGDTIVIHRDWVRGVPSMAGRYSTSAWGDYLEYYLRGEPYVVHDVASDPRMDDTTRATYRAVEMAAFIGVGLVKGGAHVASFGVLSRTPRAWTAEEVELVRETAERTWGALERARAEAALRASEAKYRTIFDSIDEGFSTFEVLYDVDGRAADLRFLEANPAFERHTGVPNCVGRTARQISPTLEDAWVESYARVARTGEPMRIEQHNGDTGRWYTVHVSRVGESGSPVVATIFNDITERKRAEATLAAAAARDAFLVRLSDALRPLGDPVAVQAEAMRVLGEHFGAVRAQLWEMEPDGRHLVSKGGYARGMAPLAARVRPEDYGVEVSSIFRAGRTLAVADTGAHPLVGEAERAAYRAVGIGSYVGVPLVKDGQWVAVLGLHRAEAHDWTPDEVALVEDVAERTWAAVERARAEAALRESAARLAAMFESLPVGVGIVDRTGAVVLSNHAMHRYLPANVVPSQDEVRGNRWRAWHSDGGVVAPHDYPGARALRGESTLPGLEMLYKEDDGKEIWTHVGAVPIRDHYGSVTSAAIVVTDVDSLMRSADNLRASEEQYRTLVDNVLDYGIFGLDPEGVVTAWTPGAEHVKGYREEEIIGRHFALFYTPDDVAAGVHTQELAQAAATGRAEGEGWRIRKGGARFWGNEIATAVRDPDGQLVGFTKIIRDLTERRAAEKSADRARTAAELDTLRRQLLQAEEEERRRLARELHDEAGQHLTALALGLQALADMVPPGSEVDLRATRLRELASTLGRDLHAIAVRLRPKALDDFGLEAAVAAYAEDWSRNSGIPTAVHTGNHPDRLPSAVESAIYRVVQEALTNVARHSEATSASLFVERCDGYVVAVVEDDGKGFDVEASRPSVGVPKLGLLGMRERATLLSGTLTVESAPGAGTSLFVRIPISITPAG